MSDPIKTFSNPDVEEQICRWLINDFHVIEPHFHGLPLDYLTTDHCRAVHRTVTRLLEAGHPVDDVVVIHEAAALVDEITKPIIYAMIGANASMTRSAFNHHLGILRDYWKRRTLQAASVAASAATGSAEIAAIWQSALEAIADPPPAPPSIGEVLDGWLTNLQDLIAGRKAPGIATGIPGLDEITCGGLRPGELWVPGGGTSSGKSALAIQLAGNLLDDGRAVYIATLEMPVCQIIDRFVCNRGSVFLSKLRDPAAHPMNEMDKRCVTRVLERSSGNGGSRSTTKRPTSTSSLPGHWP
jgi:replicative DNA helicase